MKELYIAAHEQLIGAYLEEHPDATEDEAYDKTADRAYELMTEMYADMIDAAKSRAKDEGRWPPTK
jgi:ABC-type proline/glycine betaine transport system substrate-binding protein